jgi:protein SCO1/2
MRRLAMLVLAAAASLASAQFYSVPKGAVPGESRVVTSAAGREVRVDQRLGEYLPLDAKFVDDDGRPVALGDVIHQRPVVMLPVFYRCPGICAREFAAIASSLGGFKKHFAGRDFDVVVLGIDPKETPALAAAKKDEVLDMYLGGKATAERRALAEKGAHFLTGTLPEIRKVTDALGFRFTYDPTNGSIVHPQGLMVITPAGQISQYFLGEEYPQQVLLDAILEAGKNGIGYKDDRPFFLACIQIDPLTGKRSLNIMNTVKTAGVVTMLCLVVGIVYLSRKYAASGARQ